MEISLKNIGIKLPYDPAVPQLGIYADEPIIEKDSSSQHNLQSDQIRSVAQSCPTLRPHESQHARPPCPSPTPGVH